MVHSLNTIEEETIDACNFLIRNKDIIISDLKKEFDKQISNGRELHKGFGLSAFEEHMNVLLNEAIRDMYTFDKRFYISTETVLIVNDEPEVKELVNNIIKKVMGET